MRNFGFVLLKALLTSTCAIGLAACTTSGGVRALSPDVAALVADIPGVQGKTIDDQRRIDRTVARSCSTGIMNNQQCDLHTKVSAERRAELNG